MSTIKDEKPNKVPPKKYSEVFKRHVVKEFEQGLYTISELRRRYEIRGKSCIPRWLRKYGKFSYENKFTTGRPMKDIQKQRIKELECELKHQKEALAVYRQLLEIASEEMKVDILKKYGTKQSLKLVKPKR